MVGYGFGALADAAAYNFYIMYALYFLTTVAGMGAARAGVIISVSTVISAIYAIVLLIPVVTFVVSGIIAIIYPMTKEKFELLKTELEHKRAGEEVHEEGLKRII